MRRPSRTCSSRSAPACRSIRSPGPLQPQRGRVRAWSSSTHSRRRSTESPTRCSAARSENPCRKFSAAPTRGPLDAGTLRVPNAQPTRTGEMMEAVSEEAPDRRPGFWERLLPLRHWLGADAAGGVELGQAKTRLICTFVGLCGFGVIGYFSGLPSGIIGTGIVFPLYAAAYLVLVRRYPVPTHRRRGFAVVMDNLANVYIAYFGGVFAAYVGFLFLVTIGWGLRFGRHYLFLATAIAVLGMVCNLLVSPYWQDNLLFGATIIFGLIANMVNASILLGRIAAGNRQLAEKIEEISRLAWQDQLTKLPNRPYFRDRLGQMLATAARSGRQVALLLFDIDGFKAVNDTLGHEAGDRLL